MAYLIGMFIGGLAATALVTTALIIALRRWGHSLPGVLFANLFSLLICTVIAGYGSADGGDPKFARSFVAYLIPQLVICCLAVYATSRTSKNRAANAGASAVAAALFGSDAGPGASEPAPNLSVLGVRQAGPSAALGRTRRIKLGRTFSRAATLIGAGLVGSFLLVLAAQYSISAQVPVSVGYKQQVFIDLWENGYFSASGTFTMEGERIAFPLQRSEISCRKSEEMCIVARAEIADWNGLYLNLALDRFPVEKWDRDIIIFTADALCITLVYTVSRGSQRVFATRSTKKPLPPGCEPVQQKAIAMTLADGWEVEQRLRGEASAKVMPFVWMAAGALWVIIVTLIARRASPASHARGQKDLISAA